MSQIVTRQTSQRRATAAEAGAGQNVESTPRAPVPKKAKRARKVPHISQERTNRARMSTGGYGQIVEQQSSNTGDNSEVNSINNTGQNSAQNEDELPDMDGAVGSDTAPTVITINGDQQNNVEQQQQHNETITISPEPSLGRPSGDANRRPHVQSQFVIDLTSDESFSGPSNSRSVEHAWPIFNRHKKKSKEDKRIESDSVESPAGKAVSCPICYDSHATIVSDGRRLQATFCGHVFCSRCLNSHMKLSATCPNCRKKLTSAKIHPLYL